MPQLIQAKYIDPALTLLTGAGLNDDSPIDQFLIAVETVARLLQEADQRVG